MKPDFTWIANTSMAADDWSTLSGQFTVPGDADPAELSVYIGTDDIDGLDAYTYLVDDILVTTDDDGPPDVEPGVVFSTDFGGGNPVVGFDVVNEVVADSGENPDGLRRSEWFRILGEDYIDQAFQYADEAFNDVHAAAGADQPVTLYINDYNTEQGGKQDRYFALVERLIDRDVPITGVGHQFHLNLATPISTLEVAL